jgi:hypothetical protein
MASLGCSDEQWVLDAETPLLRSQVACGFEVGRNQLDAMQAELKPGQQFTVRRRKSVEGQSCWFVRTPEGLEGWMVYTDGRAHRMR